MIPRRTNALTHEVGGDGELVVYDGERRRLLVLNEIGAAVWLLIDGQRSTAEIASLVVDTLPAPEAEVLRDVEHFVSALADDGLLEIG